MENRSKVRLERKVGFSLGFVVWVKEVYEGEVVIVWMLFDVRSLGVW